MNSVIGAVLAGLVTLGTGALVLLSGENVTAVTDISGLQWTILAIGTAVAVTKDFQAITVRRLANKVTGSGDGGGAV